MSIHAPVTNLSPQVREAFDAGCRAVFKVSEQRAWAGRASHDLLWRFAAHYQRLIALPRRTRRSIERRWKRTLSAIALLMTLGLAPAWAAVIEVSPGTPPSINADGKCSLSEAIVNANRNARRHLDCVAGAGLDTIVLPANSQQPLAAAESLPQITSPIVIEGRRSTISQNVYSNPGFFAVSASGDLTLNETTLTGATFACCEAAVSNAGRLVLNDSTIERANGLLNDGGVAILTNSTITDNRNERSYHGGGIENRAGGRLTLTTSLVTGNRTRHAGGGIFNDEGCTATLTDSTVSSNGSTEYDGGGGIFNVGTLVLVGTTVAGNFAEGGGGGIVNYGTATVRRSTISGNGAFHDYAVFAVGGGILNAGKLSLVNSTVSDNEAATFGGGIVSGSDGGLTILHSTVTGNTLAAGGYDQNGGGVFVHSGTLTLERSIVSGNTADTGLEIGVASGVAVTVNDFNLFGHDGDAGVAGFTLGSTDIIPNDPVGGILLPLADNGGRTQTHALAMGSPALDASPDDESCPGIDQRGNPRPRGPACDIGSFEGSAVLCNGRVTTMVGTEHGDELTGTAGVDVISGLNGNDAIVGLEGNDLICAGGGADRVYGGIGNDVLFGEFGNDQLFGQRGNDTLNGGPGQDQCDGGSHAGAGDSAATCETVINVP